MAKTKAERAAAKRERQKLNSLPDQFVMASLEDGEPIELDVQAAEGDGKDPTFEMVAYNGGPLRVGGYYLPVVVDLSTLKGTARRRPILMNHDHTKPVGHTSRIENDGKRLTMGGSLSVPGPDRDTVVSAGKAGFPWQASVGVSASNGKIDRIGENNSVQVNGRNVKGPVLVLRGGTLRETTICPIGADDTTRTTVAAQLQEDSTMSPELKQFIEASGKDADDLTDVEVSAFEAAYKVHSAGMNQPKPQADSTPNISDVNGTLTTIQAELQSLQNQRQEFERSQAIEAALGKYSLAADKATEIRANAAKNKWSPEKVELEAMRAERKTAAPYIQSHSQDDHDSSQVIAAGLMQAANIDDDMIVAEFGEPIVEASRKQGLNTLSLQDAFSEYAWRFGQKRLNAKTDEGYRDLIATDRDVQASGFSTLSLSGIVGAVANKSLLSAYQQAEITCMDWCAKSTVSNFQTHTRYRLTQDGNLAEVGAGGEIKHTTLSEASYTNQADTHALMISLTRKMMKNDDLGAFASINREMGYAAAAALEQAASQAITGATASTGATDFFSTSSSKTTGDNYFTGASSALDIDSLTTAVQLFRERTNTAGNPVMFKPSLLLVPPALETTASQLYGTLPVNFQATGSTDATFKGFAENPHVGKYRPIVVDYFANSNGYPSGGTVSSTAWYLLADPNRVATVDIAFLDGKQTPTIETSETDFNTLGMQFRCYFDFGVATQDDIGAVKSKGAA